jgi:NADPH:quinone reductase-like Zn-dependent oxidoreductase
MSEKQTRRINVLKKHISNEFLSPQLKMQHTLGFNSSYKQLLIVKKSSNYREASKVVQVSSLPEPRDNQILVKHLYAGVQGSEIMISKGVYGPLKTRPPPIVAGSEGSGIIIKVGPGVKKFKEGQAVLFASPAYTEYSVMNADHVFPLKEATAEAVSVLISGTTAYLALQERARMDFSKRAKKQLKVLVTGAAGATGSFAVQLAKLAGHYVIGTCGGEDKAQLLKELGCDRVINYRKEDIDKALKEIGGVDIVYEGVGGEVFHKCLNNLNEDGIFIVIGFISQYKSDHDPASKEQQAKLFAGTSVPALVNGLLMGNRTISGFFLVRYMYDKEKIPIWRDAVHELIKLYETKKIKIPIDEHCRQHFNKGPESVCDAIDYLQAGKNSGKVFVSFSQQ